MNETLTKLQTITVGSGGASSVTFSNIPQNYTDLVIKYSARSNGTSNYCDGFLLSLNGISTGQTGNALYQWWGSHTASDPSFEAYLANANTTAGTFGNGEIYFSNYSGSNYKAYSADSVTENGATYSFNLLSSGIWANTSPITSITLTVSNSFQLVQYSTLTLYGVKNMATVLGNSIKATGGIITTDGTYVYHIFNSAGTFQPTTRILADYMVVGGGAGGQAGGPQGVGGGGGYVSVNTGVTLSPGVGYVATIGSGGAGAVAGGATAVAGTSSTFYNLTSSGGGVGGVAYYYPDRGGSSGNIINGTSTSYTGGQTVTSDNAHLAGGGGAGAGANGKDSSGFTTTVGSSVGGDGYSHPVGNVYGISAYYGGGGNGGTEGTGANGGWGAYAGYIPTYTSKGGGGWGGGQYPTSNPASAPTAGLSNTGGGGGGGTWGNSVPIVSGAGSGAAGGSGVVIVRYKA